VGAIMPEVVAAAEALAAEGVKAGVVCLTSPDLVFRSFQQRGRREDGVGGSMVGELFPAGHRAPLVTVLDGHPHTLAFLAGVRGDRIRCLGVTEFGQSSGLDDAYRIHHIDTGSIVDAAMTWWVVRKKDLWNADSSRPTAAASPWATTPRRPRSPGCRCW